MQIESIGNTERDVASMMAGPGALRHLEELHPSGREYQSQFLTRDYRENAMRGFAVAIPMALVFWVMMGLLLWRLAR